MTRRTCVVVAICDILLVVGIPATEWARFLVIQPHVVY